MTKTLIWLTGTFLNIISNNEQKTLLRDKINNSYSNHDRPSYIGEFFKEELNKQILDEQNDYLFSGINYYSPSHFLYDQIFDFYEYMQNKFSTDHNLYDLEKILIEELEILTKDHHDHLFWKSIKTTYPFEKLIQKIRKTLPTI